jgi:molybdenum cofactor cytidylyltransferase
MTMQQMTPILILAAGAGTRMGGADKLALPVGGTPLLRDRALAALATGAPVHIALPAPGHPRAALVADLPVTLHHLPEAALGQAHTLRAAVAALPPSDRFLVLLADLPEITTADLRAVLDAPRHHPDALIWRGATARGEPGHPVLFDAALRPAFAGLTGDRGADSLIRAHKDRTVLVPLPGRHARRDLDTPADWAAFRAETGL